MCGVAACSKAYFMRLVANSDGALIFKVVMGVAEPISKGNQRFFAVMDGAARKSNAISITNYRLNFIYPTGISRQHTNTYQSNLTFLSIVSLENRKAKITGMKVCLLPRTFHFLVTIEKGIIKAMFLGLFIVYGVGGTKYSIAQLCPIKVNTGRIRLRDIAPPTEASRSTLLHAQRVAYDCGYTPEGCWRRGHQFERWKGYICGCHSLMKALQTLWSATSQMSTDDELGVPSKCASSTKKLENGSVDEIVC